MNTVDYDQSRYNMWGQLIPYYEDLTRSAKKRAKVQYAAERGIMPHNIGFDCCQQEVRNATVPPPSVSSFNAWYAETVANKKQENNMYTNTPDALETQKRNYLSSRLVNLKGKKVDKLRQAYGLDDEDRPLTPKELLERIKSGKFVIRGEHEDTTDPYNLLEYFSWREPDRKEDKVGFRTAREPLDKAYDEAKDTVIVLPLEDALAAVKKFEEAEFK